VIRQIAASLVLASIIMPAKAADSSSADTAAPDSMRFEWRTQGPAEACGNHCRTWISATGVITEDTAQDFETFVAGHNAAGSVVAIDSEGGSVIGAIAFGRLLRRLNMTTMVGRTIELPAPANAPARAKLSTDAWCQSMCAFLMLGGVRRYVAPDAHVLVHQIWLTAKAKNAQQASYSAAELGHVQRDVGTLARYTVEMGGDIELLETALRTPPWEPLHRLSADDVRRMRLSTVDHPFESDDAIAGLPAAQPASLATSAHAVTGAD